MLYVSCWGYFKVSDSFGCRIKNFISVICFEGNLGILLIESYGGW